MRSLRAWTLVTTFALVASAPRVGRAYCRMTSPLTPPGQCEAGALVSWSSGSVGVFINTRGLSVPREQGEDLDALVRRYVASSASAWSDASCGAAGPARRFVVAGDVDAALDVALDGRNVISVNRRWTPDAYHRPGTIAFTVVTADAPTGTLLEADVELNALAPENPLGREFGDGAPTWGVADAPTVILHELGHVTGLWHSLEAGAVMEPSMDVERQRRTLTDDDRRGACALERPAARGVRASVGGGGCSAARGVTPRYGCVPTMVLVGLCIGCRRRPAEAPGGSLVETEKTT